MRHGGLPINIIADKIHRSPATLSRELKRNNPIYSPSKAQRRYQNCKTSCGRKTNKKSSEPITRAITELLKVLPQNTVRLLVNLKQNFIFPIRTLRQRGTSENINGLIREYLPKAADIDPLDDDYLRELTEKLNKRPRKCLDWKTPYEIFFQKVSHLI